MEEIPTTMSVVWQRFAQVGRSEMRDESDWKDKVVGANQK